jgi:hypothetical protein
LKNKWLAQRLGGEFSYFQFFLSKMGIRILILFDVDPDPTFHPDADPDRDSSFQINAQTLEKVLK